MDNNQQSSSTAFMRDGTDKAKVKSDSTISVPFGIMKSMKRKDSTGLSSSNGGGSGNNSDGSGLASLENNSFGFNFDTDEAMLSNSASPTESDFPTGTRSEAQDAETAEAIASNLRSIASACSNIDNANNRAPKHGAASVTSNAAVVSVSQKSSTDEYSERPNKKSKQLDEDKREERNAREKERSFRISRQINELRNLLSSGGVIVPKGTKSSVLTEAANYIRMLQQHQYRSEIDRHQLVQQMQMIGAGALGPQAAAAIRHVSAQNGVWSLGNFGGVPPKSAMSFYNRRETETNIEAEPVDPNAPVPTKIEDHEYRHIFNSCSVGMAIASMGGALIDCNQLFCQLSNYSKQEVCGMTIFNLTCRQDLQPAFDLISQMISPPADGRVSDRPKPIVLRGSMKHRDDLGLSISLIKGDDNIAKCFCVTLIKNPESPFDPRRPVPATADMIQIMPQLSLTGKDDGSLNSSPAYTTG